jgi:hypothetical protein
MQRVHPHLESTKPTSKGRFPPSIYADRRWDRGGRTVLRTDAKDWARELSPRVRAHPGAAAPLVGLFGHRLRVVGLFLGLDLHRGYGWVQFGDFLGFLL